MLGAAGTWEKQFASKVKVAYNLCLSLQIDGQSKKIDRLFVDTNACLDERVCRIEALIEWIRGIIILINPEIRSTDVFLRWFGQMDGENG